MKGFSEEKVFPDNKGYNVKYTSVKNKNKTNYNKINRIFI